MEGAPLDQPRARPGGAPSGWEGYREHPYRIFFPPWVPPGLGRRLPLAAPLPGDPGRTTVPFFTRLAQIQGFMTCFAVGSSFTAIPRRTGTASPSRAEARPGRAGSRRYERCRLVLPVRHLAGGLARVDGAHAPFRDPALRPGAGGGRRPGSSGSRLRCSWGVGGSVLISSYGVLGDEYFELHELGRLYLLQGMFVCLVLGAGVMVLPLLTRGASSTDFGARSGDASGSPLTFSWRSSSRPASGSSQAVSLRGGGWRPEPPSCSRCCWAPRG